MTEVFFLMDVHLVLTKGIYGFQATSEREWMVGEKGGTGQREGQLKRTMTEVFFLMDVH
jgi:hypothetical protein